MFLNRSLVEESIFVIAAIVGFWTWLKNENAWQAALYGFGAYVALVLLYSIYAWIFGKKKLRLISVIMDGLLSLIPS
jgi:hypothetical protein